METSFPEHKAYWRKSVTITWLALFLWAVVTVLIGIYAREARELTAVYAVLTGLYAWYLSRQGTIHRC
jgi:putative solute:sodium symporter small subunit